MTEKAPAASQHVDLVRPNAARMYDSLLGGDSNYAVDREAVKWVLRNVWHDTDGAARQNRDLLGRFIRNTLDAGIRQFIDLGSGIPTVGNVHHIVRDTLGDEEYARVVYVDYESVAVAHSHILLEDDGATDWAGMVEADVRYPHTVLGHETTRGLIDWDQPVALTCIALLHFLSDADDPGGVVARYARGLPAGSWICFSHFTADDAPEEGKRQVAALADFYTRNSSNPLFPRSLAQIGPWFAIDGWEPVNPGLVHGVDWRPAEALTKEDIRLRPYFWAGAIRREQIATGAT